jgi:hypothetical protein
LKFYISSVADDDIYDEVIEYDDDYSDVFSEYMGDSEGSESTDGEVTLNAVYSSYSFPPPLPRRLSDSRPPPRPPLPASYYTSL